MTLFAPVVIGQSDYFGFGFSTVISKPLFNAHDEKRAFRAVEMFVNTDH